MARPKPDDEFYDCEFTQKHISAALEFGQQQWTSNTWSWIWSSLRWQGFESPLEMAFAAWWRVMREVYRLDDVDFVHQQECVINGKTYRLDFAAKFTEDEIVRQLQEIGVELPRIAIELDGHEFHERTKEQVAYRNERDRALQGAGWIVMHFSGSEFNANPEQCLTSAYNEASRRWWNLRRALPKISQLQQEQMDA